MSFSDVIIIGAGHAGYGLAKSLRRLDKSMKILIITQDSGHFYSKPSLSVSFSANKKPTELIQKDAVSYSRQIRVDILTHTTVLSVDRKNRCVSTPVGDYHYGRLVMATGASPKRLDIGGDVSDAVCSINNIDDYCDFKEKVTGKRRVTVVGAGLVGLEFANDLAKAGLDVKVVSRSAHPLADTVPYRLGVELIEQLVYPNLSWYMGTTIQSARKVSDGGVRLTLASGDAFTTDIVLSAIGLKPNLELAVECGLKTDKGILTDDSLKTSDEHIYALGDCAEICGHSLMYLAPLMVCIRALSKTLIGQTSRLSLANFPVTVKIPELPISYSFHASRAAQMDKCYSENSALYYDQNERLTGFFLMGDKAAQAMTLSRSLPNLI